MIKGTQNPTFYHALYKSLKAQCQQINVQLPKIRIFLHKTVIIQGYKGYKNYCSDLKQ